MHIMFGFFHLFSVCFFLSSLLRFAFAFTLLYFTVQLTQTSFCTMHLFYNNTHDEFISFTIYQCCCYSVCLHARTLPLLPLPLPLPVPLRGANWILCMLWIIFSPERKEKSAAAILYCFPFFAAALTAAALGIFWLLCSPTLNNSNWALSIRIRSNYVLPRRVLVSIRRKFLIMRVEPLSGGGFVLFSVPVCVCLCAFVCVSVSGWHCCWGERMRVREMAGSARSWKYSWRTALPDANKFKWNPKWKSILVEFKKMIK